jgi:hypothetical protein
MKNLDTKFKKGLKFLNKYKGGKTLDIIKI